MTNTYRAIEVTAPGALTLVDREMPNPGYGQLRIRVQAAGICHSDAMTVEGYWPGINYPRVPGHEIVGVIDAIGEGVNLWKVGQRVGLGWFGGGCGDCRPCRRGDFVNCMNMTISGISADGGYAEVVLADARAVASIPDDIAATDAAPLLCAGVTTFNALRNAKLRSSDVVAIQGIGGLGHLAIQYAKRMGFYTVAIARGKSKAETARDLGADLYIDSTQQDPAELLTKLGGADAILATAASGKSMGPLIRGLSVRGKLIVVGTSHEPLEVNLFELLSGSRSIQTEIVGTPLDEEETIEFSARHCVRPIVETVPLERVPDAYARVMRNEARFRTVITMERH